MIKERFWLNGGLTQPVHDREGAQEDICTDL